MGQDQDYSMEQPASMSYIVKVQPTEAELNLIARLRQARGMCIYDADSHTLWIAGKPEYCNGKHYAEQQHSTGNFWLPVDTA